MTLDEKIKVLEAAKRGERIQHKQKAYFYDDSWSSAPNWKDLSPVVTNSFNFAVFDYRVAPKNMLSITTRKGTNYEITSNDDGSITFSCETVEKKDVDAIFVLRGSRASS